MLCLFFIKKSWNEEGGKDQILKKDGYGYGTVVWLFAISVLFMAIHLFPVDIW